MHFLKMQTFSWFEFQQNVFLRIQLISQHQLSMAWHWTGNKLFVYIDLSPYGVHLAWWWRHRTGSTLAQVMAWCLASPSHYLNQCRPPYGVTKLTHCGLVMSCGVSLHWLRQLLDALQHKAWTNVDWSSMVCAISQEILKIYILDKDWN